MGAGSVSQSVGCKMGAFNPDTYCGVYCGACSIVLRGKTGRADDFAACLGGVPRGDFACGGCKSDTVYAGCSTCSIRRCARERGVAHCSDCGGDGFDPQTGRAVRGKVKSIRDTGSGLVDGNPWSNNGGGSGGTLKVQYNPKEVGLDKAVPWQKRPKQDVYVWKLKKAEG